jgi:hypothetical protein
MRVPNVRRRSWKRISLTRARVVRLESLQQPRALERPAAVGMAEDQVVVPLPDRVLRVALELARQAVGEWHRPRGALRLRLAELAADVTLAHAHPGGGPVDVAPAQRRQLPLAQTGHRGGEVQDPVERLEGAVRNRSQQCVELGLVEKADLGILSRRLRERDVLAGVAGNPPLLLGVREDRVEEADVVAHRLGREAVPELLGDEALDLAPADLVERRPTEEWHEKNPEVRLVVPKRRTPTAERRR